MLEASVMAGVSYSTRRQSPEHTISWWNSVVRQPRSHTLAVLLGLLSTAALAQARAIEVGKPFPNLRLATLDGQPASIEDFRGTKVVLHVFASW